ncbi:hypothetical protein D3C71_1683040 [compost metagenome]
MSAQRNSRVHRCREPVPLPKESPSKPLIGVIPDYSRSNSGYLQNSILLCLYSDFVSGKQQNRMIAYLQYREWRYISVIALNTVYLHLAIRSRSIPITAKHRMKHMRMDKPKDLLCLIQECGRVLRFPQTGQRIGGQRHGIKPFSRDQIWPSF